MKKIIVCGASFGSNFGDLLFADMFLQHIRSELPQADIYFHRTSRYTEELMGLKPSTFVHRAQADALVYMSGGLFCGLPPKRGIKNKIKRARFFRNYFAYGILSASKKRPIAIVGVDAGPLYGRSFLSGVRIIFNAASLIVVRNQESFEFLRGIGVTKPIYISADSALAADKFTFPQGKAASDEKERKTVIIHVTKHEAMRKYIDNIVSAAAQVYGSDEKVRFVVTDDYMIGNPWIEEARAVLPAGRTTIHQYDDPYKLLSLVRACDTIITPKLHLGIYGCLFGKKVFSFPVHPAKTKRFYRQIDYETHCLDLEETGFEAARTLFKMRSDERAQVPDEMKRMAENNFDLLGVFLREL